jgi:hypothetical protein
MTRRQVIALVVAVALVGVGLGIGAIIWSGGAPAPTTQAETRPPVPPPVITLELTSAVWHCISDAHRYGLVVTSTTGGVHAPNSYHYRSMAADVAGSMTNMLRMQRHLYTTHARWLEVFGPSGYMSVKNRAPLHLNEGSALALEHDDHVHCAG